MHFIGKSWKVIGGLVVVLRGKGYSTRMVSVKLTIYVTFLDKLLVGSLDNVDRCASLRRSDRLGNDSRMESFI